MRGPCRKAEHLAECSEIVPFSRDEPTGDIKRVIPHIGSTENPATPRVIPKDGQIKQDVVADDVSAVDEGTQFQEHFAGITSLALQESIRHSMDGFTVANWAGRSHVTMKYRRGFAMLQAYGCDFDDH